jgi:valyl-tRNA synthetase
MCFSEPVNAGTTAGQDLNLSLDRVNSNRNFTNKLWNAGKFILFQLEGVSDAEWGQLSRADFSSSSSSSWQGLSLSDRWVLSSLHQVCCGLRTPLQLWSLRVMLQLSSPSPPHVHTLDLPRVVWCLHAC